MSIAAVILNKETGEYICETRIKSNRELECAQKHIEIRKSVDTFYSELGKSYGNFSFLFYNDMIKEVEKQHMFRFVFLCTFSDYDNNLIYGNLKGDGRFMVAKDLQEVLGLGKTETNTTKNILIAKGLMIEVEGRLKVSDKFCIKGKIEGNQKKEYKVRVFEDAVKELYVSSSPREHKQLGMLIEMLPYVNLKFNIICENPECELMEEIIPINLTKLASIMGYSDDNSCVQKLKRGLFSVTVANECAISVFTTGAGSLIIVNPRIYYKGTQSEDVKYLAGIFKLAKKSK